MTMRIEQVKTARRELDNAIQRLDEAYASWAESVTSQHMADLKLREGQKALRLAFTALVIALNGEA